MTRTTARELAVLIAASMASGKEDAETVLDRFFEPEHYATLAAEGPQFAEPPNRKQLAYIRSLVTLTAEHRDELDAYIEQYAHGWKAERLSRAAGAILRCALCEILYFPDVPDASAISAAVDIAKKYEGEEGPAFVNGVLGGFMRGRGAETESVPEEDAPAASDEPPAEA